jgi:predicted Fe-Mo cluster-binding NifX family protein
MKIAVPYNGGRVNEHFGQSRKFAIYSVEGGTIIDSKIIDSQDFCHNHDGLAGILKAEGVEAVIAGGIGQPMVVALQTLGFKIVTGASGDAPTAAEDYSRGSLVAGNIDICSCGDHEQHGH